MSEWVDEYSAGWIDSWQLRNKKDVHPSHALAVVSVAWLKKTIKELQLNSENNSQIEILQDLLVAVKKEAGK